MESTEIDLSEFQEGNSDGADNRSDNSGQADAQPTEPASGGEGRNM